MRVHVCEKKRDRVRWSGRDGETEIEILKNFF